MDSRIDLQNILHKDIPITRRIGIQVEHCEVDRVVLTAPIEPNLNHKCTAFGGSLYSVAVLTGWSFIHYNLQLHGLTGTIVIQHSETDYIIPVDGQIRAECVMQQTENLYRFIKMYKRKGRARMSLQIKIMHNDSDAMILNAQYVVHTHL